MDSHVFSSLLRSFAQLGPIQLERAQEHLRHQLQHDRLHQALAAQVDTSAVCPGWKSGVRSFILHSLTSLIIKMLFLCNSRRCTGRVAAC